MAERKSNIGKNKKGMIGVFGVIVIAVLVVAGAATYYYITKEPRITTYPTELKQFNSYDELASFVNNSEYQTGDYNYGGGIRLGGMLKNVGNLGAPTAMMAESADSSSSGASASDYSQTNIQVEGVDEADIMKNDGKYIYTLSNDRNKVIIVEAYPADEMNIVGEIVLNKSISNIYLNGDKLVVFSQTYDYGVILPYGNDGLVSSDSGASSGVAVSGVASSKIMAEGYYPYRGNGYSKTLTDVYVYDISDRSNPELSENISVEGNYVDSRMIGGYVYLISQKYVYADRVEPPIYLLNGIEKTVPVNDIYYFDYMDYSRVFTLISAIKINNGDFNTQVYLTGYTGTIYVSQNNIFLTHQKTFNYREYNLDLANEVYLQILPISERVKVQAIIDAGEMNYERINRIGEIVNDYSSSLTGNEKADFDKKLMVEMENFEQSIAKKQDMTEVYKIGIDKGEIDYKAKGEFPGHLLNQFSMDEFEGNFRVATTTGNFWSGTSLNNLYVLNEDLEVLGKVEDLAAGEKIYSARFMGNRAYMVTFKNIDPLFVIDLSNAENPKVLGYLKVTGYSDYLHPYDENHIIGIGKEAIDATESSRSNFAWYQGLKVSLFDVSDVENPREIGKVVIGDRGTNSEALYEHKAFLFDKKRNLLVLPITLAEINKSKYRVCSEEELKDYRTRYDYCLTDSTYGETVWQGAYVLNVDLNGVSVKGKITHVDEYTGVIYGSAKDELVGAKRTDGEGIVWTKVSIEDNNERYYYQSGEWRAENMSSVRYDYNIDNFPGGTNYIQNLRYDYRAQIKRSLFMDNVLYTVSQSKIKAKALEDLDELNKINLPYEEQRYFPYEVYAVM